MAEYPLDHQSSPSPTSFAYLLADVWWSLYPSGEVPRYQVLQTTLGGPILEYHAKVYMAVTLLTGVRTYTFQGGHTSTPECAIQLAALSALSSLRHQESVMHQNRAFHFYPIWAGTSQQVRFPRPLAEADAAVTSMSRYMVAEYSLIVELSREARLARRALAATFVATTPPPVPSASGDPSMDRSA